MLTKINVNLSHLLCFVVLAAENSDYRLFGGFAFGVYVSVIRERKGGKHFRTAPASSRFSPRKAHRPVSIPSTKQSCDVEASSRTIRSKIHPKFQALAAE